MQRVSGANYAANAFGVGKNGYQDYNAANGQAGTTPNAAALNALQEEMASFIEAGGLVLNANDNTQLAQAIAAYVNGAIAPYETAAAASSALANAIANLDSPAQVAAAITAALAAYAPINSPALTGAPTAPTAAVGTSSAQLATTAFANPASSVGASGYHKLPSGLIIQWGSVTGSFTQGLFGPYSFPIAFPTGVLNLSLTTISPESAGGSAGDDMFQIPSTNLPTAAQFYAWNDSVQNGVDKSSGFYWVALGH